MQDHLYRLRDEGLFDVIKMALESYPTLTHIFAPSRDHAAHDPAGQCRRLAKDWEKSIASADAWILIAAIRKSSRQIAKKIPAEIMSQTLRRWNLSEPKLA